MEWWQWQMLGVLLRLGVRFGQWPSNPECAKALRIDVRWSRMVLESLRADELCVNTGHGASAGWMPTAEGLRWRGESMPRLVPGCAAPRSYRWSGCGAVRAWNRKQRLRADLAAYQAFDREEPLGEIVE